jgi:putative transposase
MSAPHDFVEGEEGRKTVRGTAFPTTGTCESFNAKLRDALRNGELFYSLAEARIVIESWRQHYNNPAPALKPRLQAARAGRHIMAGRRALAAKPSMHWI